MAVENNLRYNATLPTLADGQYGGGQLDANGRLITTSENSSNLTSRKTADGQVKAGAGFLHSITIAPTTATPTAGLLTIYDSLTETGTVLYSEWVFTTTPGHTVILDVPFATGVYVGYDATLANVSVTVSYR